MARGGGNRGAALLAAGVSGLLVAGAFLIAAGVAPAAIGVGSVASDNVAPAGSSSGIGSEVTEGRDVEEGISQLHEEGVTGNGTTVGVVGTRFDAHDDAIRDAVVAHHYVSGGSLAPSASGSTAHDTAVAEVVARTAPDADLVLVEVGSNPDDETYRAAMDRLLAADVDVVVDAGSYFPTDRRTADGFAAAADSVAEEAVFVTSAGNLGERHWSGDVPNTGWTEFDDDTEANRLGEDSIAGAVSVRLHWEGDADLELYLYRERPDEDRVVAADTDGEGVAAIDARVPRGQYYVAVYAADGEPATDVSLYSLDHDLAHSVADGSVPAAAGERTLAVGAADGDGLRADSSRDGITLVGPDTARTHNGELSGTSAAAPYVAGAVALVAGQSDLGPRDSQRLLLMTAERNDDAITVDPERALDVADRTVVNTNAEHATTTPRDAVRNEPGNRSAPPPSGCAVSATPVP